MKLVIDTQHYFYGDTPFEYITPFNQPMLDMLNKIHGVTATVVNMKLNF